MVIYGPTASGKSDLSDLAGDLLSEGFSTYSQVMVVDSMQVYKEIPIITNQHRSRPAELTGIVSVSQEWTMAHHRAACDELAIKAKSPFVLDVGTGMYLNSILLDIPISPRVPERLRKQAESQSSDESNPRRASRELELELAGAEQRGSIWEGSLRYDVEMMYLRPERSALDTSIAARSSKITRNGLQEALALTEMLPEGIPNRSVKESIGVKELVLHTEGMLSLEEAERQIHIRTRRLARRQLRWFDKLTKTLTGRTNTTVSEEPISLQKPIEDYVNKCQEFYA
ncbi:MAG: hypothetical protein WA982_17675 [Rubrobacteraceae bacterium]